MQNRELIISNYCKQDLFPFKLFIIITLERMFAFCRIGYIAILRGLRGYSTGNEISYYQVFLCLRQIQIKVNGVTKS